MKVVQINEVCGFGSTGSICKDISEYTINNGEDNIVFYGQRESSYSSSRKFGYRWDNLIHSFLFTRILGIHGYGSIFSTFSLIRKLKKIRPDIIHLHNLHTNFINYPLLYNYIIKSNIPVVMTLHDCYNFTGQCEHYVGVNCTRYQDGCGDCPFIHKTIAPSLIFDWSKFLLSNKRRWYERIQNMSIVAVSKWLQSQAEKSVLAVRNHQITTISNWIDTDIFYPRSQDEISCVYNKYRLKSNLKYILAVSASWKHETTKFKDIITLYNQLPSAYSLIVVGSCSPKTEFPDNIIYINYTEDINELACLYSLAYAYVHVSVCDTFGKVIAEAMSCGTPPIVYDSTACSEITGGYGLTVKPHDISNIISNLGVLERNDNDAMVNYVKSHYSKITNLQMYQNIYKKLSDGK